MAKAKTTKTEPKPKTYTLTEAQFKSLQKISSRLGDIRQTLDGTEGEENISTVMFRVGSAHTIVDWCEDGLDDILNTFDSYEDYDDEDLFN